MKVTRINTLITLFLLTAIFAGCSEDILNHGDDPIRPVNEMMDLRVSPGDDFNRYCNGAWIKSHPCAEDENSVWYADDFYSVKRVINEILASNDPMIRELVKQASVAQPTQEQLLSVRNETARQLAEIDALTSMEDVANAITYYSLRGYNTGIKMFTEPIERRVQMALEPYVAKPATADAWLAMTGCDRAEAESMHAMTEAIYGEWDENIDIAIKTGPYTTIPRGRALIAKALGLPAERVIYGETIDFDRFFTVLFADAYMDKWKNWLKQSVVAHNYRWTYPSTDDLGDYLYEGCNPFAYRLTKIFTDLYSSEMRRDAIYEMAEELREDFAEQIMENSWLDASTKTMAIEKIKSMGMYVGYPDTWIENRMGTVPTTTTTLLESMRQLEEEWVDIRMGSITDHPTEDEIWYTLTQHIQPPFIENAMNITESNGLYIYLPELLKPFYTIGAEEAYNYGALGCVIGHELGHGFDAAGSMFGPIGEWKDWWTVNDKSIFNERMDKLANHFSAYEIEPGLHSNGKQTTVEDVADLNGIHTTYRAMLKHYVKKGVSNEQLRQASMYFFLGYANSWATNFSMKGKKRQISSNIHSLPELRINCIVQQMDEWYDLYDVKPGDRLYLKPEDRVKIWNDTY